jgi:hypothetical protein
VPSFFEIQEYEVYIILHQKLIKLILCCKTHVMHSNMNVVTILVGNKYDLESLREELNK